MLPSVAMQFHYTDINDTHLHLLNQSRNHFMIKEYVDSDLCSVSDAH